MKSSRITYLDFLRCLAIFLVISLHAMVPIINNAAFYGTISWYFCVFGNAFCRAGVPLFFMISGFLLLRDPASTKVWEFYQRHIPRLVIPLISWNLIYYLYSIRSDASPFLFSELLGNFMNRGSSYHMWFVYSLLGIYFITPFLKRIIDACSPHELLVFLLIIIVPVAIIPMINLMMPVYIRLFDPLVEGYIGYFILGYVLGSKAFHWKQRFVFCVGGALGVAIDVVGNILFSSQEEIVLPFNLGYFLTHYLCAAALFVGCKTIFSQSSCLAKKTLAQLSDLVFGVFWIHVIILDSVAQWIGQDVSIKFLLTTQILLTTLISFSLAYLIDKIRPIRFLFM